MSIHNNETTWKEKANAEYQKVISIFMGLSSGALILPTLFLREFVAIPPTEPLLPHLSYAVYVAWVLFGGLGTHGHRLSLRLSQMAQENFWWLCICVCFLH